MFIQIRHKNSVRSYSVFNCICRVDQTHRTGELFYIGETKVTYVSQNKNGDIENCVFNITVSGYSSISLSIHLSIFLSISLSIHLSIYLSIYISIFISIRWISIYLYVLLKRAVRRFVTPILRFMRIIFVFDKKTVEQNLSNDLLTNLKLKYEFY